MSHGRKKHKYKPRKLCLGCGCSDRYPCIIDAETGETCRMVETGCCSRCMDELNRKEFPIHDKRIMNILRNLKSQKK